MADSPGASNAATACTKFLGIGKRIPKDVRRHCGICRQHGEIVETRGHQCPRKDCSCDKCALIKERRSIMSTQIRLRREQDRKFQRTHDVEAADLILQSSDLNSCYVCQKCKNHGVLNWKKNHKKLCSFANCPCEHCALIDNRRALDRTLKGDRRKAFLEKRSFEESLGNGSHFDSLFIYGSPSAFPLFSLYGPPATFGYSLHSQPLFSYPASLLTPPLSTGSFSPEPAQPKHPFSIDTLLST